MANWRVVRRVLTPTPVVQLYYYWKHGAVISAKAEVELVGGTTWGRDCVISAYTKIKIPGPLTLGDRVHIGTGCFIDSGWAGLAIGDDVEIGPNCTIVGVTYRFDSLDVPLAEQGLVTSGIRIGHRVRLGPNCVVLDGSQVDDDTVVPAGTVISGRFAPKASRRVTPARVVLPQE
ncbi:MAG TPA: DapH/DapD/GlmU-related protein [Gemmatimonadales bacterium]|nr:DapH/DapD/GlmU-related protein [Gemmatimonadales bacterium]